VPSFLSTLTENLPKARKTGLTAFSTPGFNVANAQPSTALKTRREVVYVSSDSAPSTPGIKRDSSDLSILGEPTPHVPKRQRKAPDEEKENVLQPSSKINVSEGSSSQRAVSRLAREPKKDSDLASVSVRSPPLNIY